VLDLVGRHAHGAVFDVRVAALGPRHLDAQRLALIALRHRDDGLRQRGGEEQRAPLARRRVEDELQVLAEPEVEHLVGLVEHHRLQRGDIQPAALEVIAQAPRRADDDVGALRQASPLAPRVHAADAGDDARAGLRIEPGELALDLQGQLARRRNDERRRLPRLPQAFGVAEERGGDGEAVGDGLARAGLRGDEQVTLARLGGQHGLLHRRRLFVIARREGAGERRTGRGKCQTGEACAC
jgi:hypothetical protein